MTAKKLLELVDSLAIALVNHNHKWTVDERKNYEAVVRELREDLGIELSLEEENNA